MTQDIKKGTMIKFENQLGVIILCDLNNFDDATTGYRKLHIANSDNIINIMKGLVCPAEYTGLDTQQVKPLFDADKFVDLEDDNDFDEEIYINYLKNCIMDILKLINIDNIYIIHRDKREADHEGKIYMKYSYHFIVDGIRISLAVLKALLILNGYGIGDINQNVFDLKVYGTKQAFFPLYSDKKKDMKTKKVYAVPPLKIYGNINEDIYKYFPSYILNSFVDYDEKFKHLIKPKKTTKELIKPDIINNILSKMRELTDVELNLIKQLVNCLDKSRSDDYNEWLNVGWCLYNISDCDKCFKIWDEFSQQSPSYKDGECQKLWYKMTKKGMTIGSLKYWAKCDNYEKYNEIMKADLGTYIDKAINAGGRHYDVALVIARYKDGEITYDKKTYFTIDKNCIWKKQTDDSFIIGLCGNEIANLFRQRAIYWLNMSMQHPDKKDMYDEKSTKAGKIAQLLGNTSFANSIKAQLPSLMLVEDFLETKLDENIHLFAFNNCVFDMIKKQIRKIEPSDYISITTGYDYDNNPDENIINEIYRWFNMWFNTDEMRKYVMEVLASTMYGKNVEQAFYIWTGSACNGKSFLQDFMANMMGKYTLKINATTLTIPSRGQNQNTEMCNGKGRRYTYTEEPEDNTENKMIASRIKEYSGDSVLTTKGLYKDPVSWKPQFRIFISCNNIPEVSSSDDGVKRRFKIIDFPNVFKENPRLGEKLSKNGDETKPYYEYALDVNMKDKKNDIKYIQALAYIFICIWKSDISYNTIIKVPECVKIRSDEYIDGCNDVKSFLEARVIRCDDIGEKVDIADLLRQYKYEGIENKKMKANKFIDEIKRLGYIVKKNEGYYKIYSVKMRCDDDTSSE